MDADLVPGLGDLGGDLGPARDLLADEEERRRRAYGRERLERPACPAGAGRRRRSGRHPWRSRGGKGCRRARRCAARAGGAGRRPRADARREARAASALRAHSEQGAAAPALGGREHEGGGGGELREARIRPPRPRSSARSSASPSSLREPTTAASPKRRRAASLRRMCPRPQPKEIAAQPRIVASRTVRPQVECTRTSAAAIHSGMRSVKPSTRTRGSSRSVPRCAGAARRCARTGRRLASRDPRRGRPRSPRPRRRRPSPLRRRARSLPAPAGRAPAGHRRRPVGIRNSGREKPCTQWISVAAPAIRRTSGIDSGWVTRWTSMPGTRPVVERREVGDRRADRNVQAARPPQAAEHLGDVGIGADDDVGVGLCDQPQKAGGAVARQQRLSGASRRSALREEPEADVPDDLEAVEDDARRIRAHGLDDAADRGQRVPGDDLRVGVLRAQLRGEGLRGLVVSGAHAGGEDQNSRGCAGRARGRRRFAERGRDESPFTVRDSTRPGS